MRLIDADELKECIKDRFKIETEENLLLYKSLQEILEFMLRKFEDKVIHRIDKQPTVDAVPVVHGEWVFKRTYYEADECVCSICGQQMTTHKGERMSFCPNCGAYMLKPELVVPEEALKEAILKTLDQEQKEKYFFGEKVQE